MRPDRIDIPTMLARLTPKKRVEAEDLVFELAIRRHNARRPKFPPSVEKFVEEQARTCFAAVFGDPPRPLSREEENAIRAAWRRHGRYILEEEKEMAGPDPALAPKDDGADA